MEHVFDWYRTSELKRQARSRARYAWRRVPRGRWLTFADDNRHMRRTRRAKGDDKR